MIHTKVGQDISTVPSTDFKSCSTENHHFCRLFFLYLVEDRQNLSPQLIGERQYAENMKMRKHLKQVSQKKVKLSTIYLVKL